jgi:hypothetical protein
MSREQEIKEIAYRLWENEGRPEGKDFDHYLRAEQLWSTDNGTSPAAAAATARRSAATKARTPRKTVKKAS